ncbi:MAG: hypothetical protein LBG70_02000 [Bifidobacteriaceae bacterium]|jgi:signal transduction histidine kinase|nr:hypothetical protein [Bifidobacteriaceae bacterium]
MRKSDRAERVTLIESGLVTLALSSLVAFTQWVTFSIWSPDTEVAGDLNIAAAGVTLLISFVTSSAAVIVFAVMGGFRWPLIRRVSALVVLPLLASLARLTGLRLYWGSQVTGLPALEELINGLVAPLLALVFGLYYVDSQEHTRAIEHLVTQRENEAARALSDLEAEELRVRRDVSQALHGKIQQRLVFFATRLAAVKQHAEHDGNRWAASELQALINEVDDLREAEVRQLSHQLYPTALDIGFQPAVSLLLGRIPATVAVEYTVSPAASEVDDVTNPEFASADRLLLVSALEEGITNALKHASASSLAIRLDVETTDDRQMLVVEVRDNGQELPSGEPVVMSGLARLRQRLEARGGGLTLQPDALGSGLLLRYWMPRPAEAQGSPGGPNSPGHSAAEAS